MWIRVYRDFEPYFDQRVTLTDHTTGKPKEMQFVLYSMITSTAFSRTVAKKPVALFFDLPAQQEIKLRDWTAEMQAHAKKESQDRPVPNAGIKWNLVGKLVFALVGIGIAVGGAALVNAIFIELPHNKEQKAIFLKVPVAGDRYYGSIYGQDYFANGGLQSCWVKVQEMNPRDSTGAIMLSRDISDNTFEPRTKDFENFEEPAIRVKFHTKRGRVTFKALDSDVSFESSVINNRYEDYKIPHQP